MRRRARTRGRGPGKVGWGKLLIIVVAVVRLEYLGYVRTTTRSRRRSGSRSRSGGRPGRQASLALARLAERVGARRGRPDGREQSSRIGSRTLEARACLETATSPSVQGRARRTPVEEGTRRSPAAARTIRYAGT